MSGPPGRKESPAGDVLRAMLGPLDGARIPGGCAWCDAYQTVRPIESGMWDITVHHDASCEWYTERTEEAEA